MSPKKSKIVIGGIVAAFTLAGCTVNMPADETTSASDQYTSEREIFKTYWFQQTDAEQSGLCEFAADYPTQAFMAFDEGSKGMFPRDVYEDLIDEVC